MLKVICKLGRYDINNPTYLKLENCEPCYFNDYKIVTNGSVYPMGVKEVSNLIKILTTSSSVETIFETKSLGERLAGIKDIFNFRVIAIFDSSKDIQNTNDQINAAFEYTLVYDAVYNLINPEKNYIFSMILERFHTFYNNEQIYIKKGTTQALENDVFVLDKYFMYHLFKQQEVSKCAVLNEEIKHEDSASLVTYLGYKNNLINIFHKFLFESEVQSVTCKYPSGEIEYFENEEGNFILTHPNRPYNIHPILLSNFCTLNNGKPITGFDKMAYFDSYCNNDKKYLDYYGIGNNLMGLNCYNYNENKMFEIMHE